MGQMSVAGAGAVRLKDRQRAERRAEILRAARDLFRTHGFAGTGMDEVAERAGVAKGTLYLHFSGKDDMVVALFEQAADELSRQLAEALAEPRPFAAAVAEALGLFAAFFGRHVDLFLIRTPELKGAIRERLRERGLIGAIHAQLVALIERGRREGAVAADTDADAAAALLPALARLQVGAPEMIGRAGLDQAALGRALLDIYLRGLGGPGQPAEG